MEIFLSSSINYTKINYALWTLVLTFFAFLHRTEVKSYFKTCLGSVYKRIYTGSRISGTNMSKELKYSIHECKYKMV